MLMELATIVKLGVIDPEAITLVNVESFATVIVNELTDDT